MIDFVLQFLWGLVVLAGFAGWGAVASRLFGVSLNTTGPACAVVAVDWGLYAGWGMAMLIAVGGVLSLAGVGVAPLLMALVLAGAAFFVATAVMGHWKNGGQDGGRGRGTGISRAALLVLGVAAAVLLVRYAAAVSFTGTNCADDDIAYFTFVSRLLETGTLVEPYSLRRLSGFGGQTLLQSLVVLAGSVEQGFLLDRGIAVIVSFGLVAGYLRTNGVGAATAYTVALILTAILPFPLGNSSGHISGQVLFLTLFRTLERARPGDGSGKPKSLWLVGLVAAAASSLKAPFLVAASLTVFLFWVIQVAESRPAGQGVWARHGKALFHLGASALVFLGPWMALLQRSSGTILFPLFQGNHRTGFGDTYSGALDFSGLAGFLGGFFVDPRVALFLVPLILHIFRRGSPAGLALYGATLITAILTVATLTYDDIPTLHRYVAPYLNAAFIATVIFFLADVLRGAGANLVNHPAARLGQGLLFALVIVLSPVVMSHDVARLKDSWGKTILNAEERLAYSKMQSAIPAGKKVLAVIGHPFVLDYRRNTIFNIDVPGGASPAPGMPYFRGPKALKGYLLGQSIGYIAHRDFDLPGGCIYNRKLWNSKGVADHPMWGSQGKFYLDFMDNVQALGEAGEKVYRGRVLKVIKLR